MLLKIFLFFCFYLPFQVALNPVSGIDLASARVFVLLIFFLWLAEGMRKKELVLPRGLVSILMASFLFLNLISIIAAKNPEWSARKLVFFLSVFPIYLVASSLINSREKMVRAIKFFLSGGAIVAFLGIAQFALQFIIGLETTYKLWAKVTVPFLGASLSKMVSIYPSWLVNVSGHTTLRATSLFPDPHMFSFYLGLLLPLALGMFFREKRMIYLASFVLLAAADIATFSRGGYAGIITGILAFFAFSWIRMQKRTRIVSLIFVLFFAGMVIMPSSFSSRFFSTFNPKEGSNVGRMEMWEKAWETAKNRPWIGAGIGNYPLEVKASADYREPIYAHNTYLDIASEAGFIAMLSWIFMLVSAIWKFIKLGKRDSIFIYAAGSLIIFSVHSLADTGLYSPVVLTLLLIILSFSSISIKTDEKIV